MAYLVNVTEVRSFLDLASYYRRFVEGFASIAKPLHQLIEKGRAGQFVWSPVCQASFDELKRRLTTAPMSIIQVLSKFRG